MGDAYPVAGVEGRHAVNHRNPRVTRAPLRATVDTTHGCSRLPPTYVGSPPRTRKGAPNHRPSEPAKRGGVFYPLTPQVTTLLHLAESEP